MSSQNLLYKNTVFAYIGGAVALVLLVPLLAMQVSDSVAWSLFDFFVMGALLFGAASSYVLALRHIAVAHRLKVAIIIVLVLLYVWVELAVGGFFSLGS